MPRIVLLVYSPRYVPNGNEIAIINTVRGEIKVRLDGKNAPLTVGNFIELAARGFYDNTKFHAYKPESVILGGCPITRTLGPAQVDAAVKGVLHGIHPGRGDARYTIKDEYVGKENNQHKLGSLCFAHKSDPDSGSSQFYFSLSEQPEFDNQFTVFGETAEGLEVVQKLRIGDAITSIEFEGVDEAALKEALSYEPPKPQKVTSAQEPETVA